MKVLKYLAIFYVFLIVFLMNRVFVAKDCISSILVKNIVMMRGTENVEVPLCNSNKNPAPLSYSEHKSLKVLKNSIFRLEDAINGNRLPWRPGQISLVIEEGMTESQINEELALAWVQSIASEAIANDDILRQILADIFSKIIWKNNRFQKVNLKKWVGYMYSEKDLCKVDWNPNSRKNICEIIVATQKTSLRELSAWSLRPLVVKRVAEFYDSLGSHRKIQFINYLGKLAATQKEAFAYKNFDLTNVSTVFQGTLDSITKNFGVQLNNPLVVDRLVQSPIPWDLETAGESAGPNIFIKIRAGFYNDLNGSVLATPQFFSKNTVLNQDSFKKTNVTSVSSDYLTLMGISGTKNYFVKMHVPSLLLYEDITGKRLKGLSWYKDSARLQSVLGWNPIEVY